MLIVFGGLPATGKTSLSVALAGRLGAVHIRIDSIEQALRIGGMTDIGGSGYLVGYAVAADQLALGHTVVAESVNPLKLTRDAWRNVGVEANVAVREVEVVCSDAAEHRRRAEGRAVNIAGLHLPTWSDIRARQYEPWDRDRIVIDTAGEAVAQSTARLVAALTAA